MAMRKLGVICFYSTHLLDLYQGFELCIFKNVASCELHLGLNGVTDLHFSAAFAVSVPFGEVLMQISDGYYGLLFG